MLGTIIEGTKEMHGEHSQELQSQQDKEIRHAAVACKIEGTTGVTVSTDHSQTLTILSEEFMR